MSPDPRALVGAGDPPHTPRGTLAVRPRAGTLGTALAVGVLLLGGLLAVAAPVLAPHDPMATDTSGTSLPVGSPEHPLGTDRLGRDLASRLLHGARTSLLIGLTSAAATVLLGTVIGGLAAAAPRWVDAALARLADLLLALPLLVVVLALAAVAGPSPVVVVAAIALTSWMPVALVVRAELRSQRERLYVRAATALGLSRVQLLWHHLLPGALPPVASIAAFEVGHAILTESTLSFLGLGIPPNQPSWGNLLTDARSHLLTGQWPSVAFPAAAIVVTIVAVNALASRLGSDREGRLW